MRTEVRRPRCPVERWYWIADQVSLLNVIARVRLTGHVPAGVLEGRRLTSRLNIHSCGWLSARMPVGQTVAQSAPNCPGISPV